MSVRTPPKARPGSASVSVLLALVLIGVAVVAVRDLAVSQGWSAGSPWTLSLVERIDGLGASTALAIGGIAIAVVGLLLVLLAVKPAPVTHLRTETGQAGGATDEDADLWLSKAAVAAVARGVADRVSGVISAEASRARGRSITVEVVTSQDAATVSQRVQHAIDARVQGLTRATIRVRTKEVPR